MFTGLTQQEQRVLWLLVAAMTIIAGVRSFQAAHTPQPVQIIALEKAPVGKSSVVERERIDRGSYDDTFADAQSARSELQSGETSLLLAQAVKEKININTAGAAELEKLNGVGPKTAEKIISHRQQHGPFLRIEDIQQVSGIGPKKFEAMQEQITVGGSSSAPVTPQPPTAAGAATSDGAAAPGAESGGATDAATSQQVKPTTAPLQTGPAAKPVTTRPAAKTAGKTKININTAGVAELEQLNGIGPAYAARIVADRAAHGPFRRPEDIVRVKGIGPKTLEKILPDITVGE